MQPDPIADQARRQDIALQELAAGKEDDHPADGQPVVELRQRNADRDDEAGDAAEIGDEGDEADADSHGETEIDADQGEPDAVEGGQSQADRRLAADEAGERAVDLGELLADRGGMALGQQRIGLALQAVPVAQQIEGDDGGDEKQRQEIGQRHPAGHQPGQRAADPGHDAAHHAAGLAAQIGQAFDAQPCPQLLQLGPDRGQEPVEIARQALGEAHDLALQGRQDQQDRQDQHQDEADADDGRRPDPRAAQALQPVAHGIQEISHGHAGDEGQQHGAQQIEDQQESQQGEQPEADLARPVDRLARHQGASIWAMRQPHRRI